jgi:hypothetical protein
LVINLDKNICRNIFKMDVTAHAGTYQYEVLAKVKPRESTGHIHLTDLPKMFVGDFEKWLHGQTCPGDIDNPDEMMAFTGDFERWRKKTLRKAGWVKRR